MKYIFRFIIYSIPLFLCSCDESFNPKTDFEEKYVLFGVVEYSPQTPSISLKAAVLRTFDSEGFDPSVSHTDHSVQGCVITLTIGDKEFKLSEDSLRFVTQSFRPKYSYGVSGFSFTRNQELKLKAVLPNGKVLTSKTRIPEPLSLLEFSFPFNSGVHTKLNQFIWGDTWKINWDSYDDYLFFPRLTLNYWIKTDSSTKYKTAEIPLKYIKKNGRHEPVFPFYTWEKQTEYSFDCIDSVMTQISAGDTAKSRYIIHSMSFGMLEFETNLSSYFSSTNGYLDNFSIRLDESVYTNISGGIGVFGAFTSNSQTFKVERAYVESFGYTWRGY